MMAESQIMTNASGESLARPSPLLVQILFAPRRTMRWILEHRGDAGILPLVAALALSLAVRDFDLGQLRSALPHTPWAGPALATIGLVLSVLITICLFYLIAWMAAISGRFLEGTATTANVRKALAWGSAPLIWALLYRIPALLLWSGVYGSLRARNVFEIAGSLKIEWGSFPEDHLVAVIVFLLLDLAVNISAFFVASQTLAEVQGFSAWKAFGSILMAFALPVLGIFIIILGVLLGSR